MYCADAARYTENETRTIYYDDASQLKGNPVGAWEMVNPMNDGRDAFTRIDAEYYSGQSGIDTVRCTDTDGGFALDNVRDSDWVAYRDINFGAGADRFEARVASKKTGSIEIRLGSPTGTLLGTCTVRNTEVAEPWETVFADLKTVSGKQDVYLRFKGGRSDMLSLNWFRFAGPDASEKDVHE